MAKAPKLEDFKYVDAWHSDRNGKSSAWTRIETSEVNNYQTQEAFNFNVFCTVQRFANKEREKGEAFIAPLYFDLDDSENPARSQADAIKLVDFFMRELDIQETDIEIFFSGSKGFHVLISETAVGVEPREDLHKIYKHIAGYLVHKLELTALDLVVYTAPRMLRLPNSQHQKTNLFKIELTLTELRTLQLEAIKEKASVPRRDGGTLSSAVRREHSAIRPKAAAFVAAKAIEYEEAAATSKERYDKEEFVFKKGMPPVCVQDILEGGWKKEGDRNNATVQLATYFKQAGHSKEETTEILVEWVQKFTSAGSRYQVEQRVANTRSTVDAVFSKDNDYRFGCAFIRSLHGEKKPGNEKEYERVKCAGDMCPCLKRKGEHDDVKALPMHLAQTGAAELTGKLVKTRVMVAGKKHTPYIVPKKIEYHCWGRKGCKKTWCPLYDIPSHTGYKDLGVHNRELIQMTGTGDDNIKGILKELSGVPNCAKYGIDVIETTNVEEILVIPMAEESKEHDVEEADSKYVLRRVYSIGQHGIEENKYYQVEGFVFAHPKTSEATISIKSAVPLQDTIEKFRMTDEIKEDLSIFQPADYSKDSIDEKLGAIGLDLTYNVTGIVERYEALFGALIVMHSVLRFRVPWDNDPIRGWVEGKIVGDTGTGKSALIEKLMKFAGVGNRVNAESTSRTGLTYKLEQSGSGGAWYILWGAWPQADRGMIWIDEDTGIQKDEYGEMTLARSDGRLEVKRAVTAETPCRVRAILSGNVPKGKRLADYGQGVECLKDIFNNEDIRRFDFGIFMRASDVDPELYNKALDTYPSMIASSTLKNNILFAWSRKPDDVLFTDGTIDKVLEVSTDLSKVYGNATDVPLVSPSDQRNKVARMAVALAALTHSVDESGERVVVWPGHVEFIGVWLRSIYNAPGCGLNYYAKLAIKEEEMTEEKYKRITADLKKIDTLQGEHKFYEFLKLFAQQKYLGVGDIEAMLSIDKEEVKLIVAKLSQMRMIQKTSGGFRKTPRFNAYVGKCFELGIFDSMDDEYDYD